MRLRQTPVSTLKPRGLGLKLEKIKLRVINGDHMIQAAPGVKLGLCVK